MKKKTWLILLTLVLLAVFYIQVQQQEQDYRGPEDLSPQITMPDFGEVENPPQEANTEDGFKILFDAGHGQTAGSADWVVEGAFSDFADALEDYGLLVYSSSLKFTDVRLQDYDCLIIPEANIPFTEEEQELLVNYVARGGLLFLIGDHYNADRNFNRWDANEIFNGYRRGAYDNPLKDCIGKECVALEGVRSSDWLFENFGLRFRYNAVAFQSCRMEGPQTFKELVGLEIRSHASSTLILGKGSRVVGLAYAENRLKPWRHAVDEGVYFGGREEGPLLGLAQHEAGYVLALADSSPLEDNSPAYLNEENGLEKETYDGFSEADHRLIFPRLITIILENRPRIEVNDEASPQKEFEIPAMSYEPVAEPWRKPKRHYRWFDPSTFRPGAFTPEWAR